MRFTPICPWALALFLGACGGSGNDPDPIPNNVRGAQMNGAASAPIEVQGVWESNFGTQERITQGAWDQAEIVSYDNDLNLAITQNPEDASFSPNKFNRIVWTEPESGSFYYCFVDFGLDTEEDALRSTNSADDSDPETDGCGGFSWTKLTPEG